MIGCMSLVNQLKINKLGFVKMQEKENATPCLIANNWQRYYYYYCKNKLDRAQPALLYQNQLAEQSL
jgi:hypothetical protein